MLIIERLIDCCGHLFPYEVQTGKTASLPASAVCLLMLSDSLYCH